MLDYIKSFFSAPKYKISKSDKDDQYYFVLIAKNGEVILKSEGYKTERGALSGISSVSTNGHVRSNFDIKESKDGKLYFTLKAKNGEIIGISETYNSKESVYNGIDSVSKCCGTNVIKFDH